MRYDIVPDFVVDIKNDLIDKRFPNLRDCNIDILIDNKKSTYKMNLVLAKVTKASEIVNFYALNDPQETSLDFIIFIDAKVVNCLERDDIRRIISHELQHIFYDDEKETYKLREHEITDFYDEIEYNKDNPKWRDLCAELVMIEYEKEKSKKK